MLRLGMSRLRRLGASTWAAGLLAAGLLAVASPASGIQTPELPPMTFEELCAALDPNFPDPAIPRIRDLAASGALDQALAEYLAYRRALPERHPLRDFAAEPADAPLMERSRTIAGALADEGVIIPFYVGWNQAPVQALPFDWEGLRLESDEVWRDAGRLYFLNDLGRVWRETGDDRFADIALSAALGWIALYRPHAPVWPPDAPTPYPIAWSQYPYTSGQWRPIEAGIRLQDTLTGSAAYFLDAPALTPEAHARLVASVFEHAEFLMLYDTADFNWQAIESAGLMMAGTLYPEFSRSSAWVDEAVRRASQVAERQILADGAQWELSPHYHCVVARDLWLIAELWRHARPQAPPLANIEAALERMIDFSLKLQRPDATEPLLGDSVGVLPMRAGFYPDEWRDSSGLLYGLERFGRQDWRFFAGAEGAPAPLKDAFFPEAGYGAIRSGWGAKDLYVGIDLGPLGRSHNHEDALHLSLEEGGHRWLADSGRGPYGDGPFRDSYFVNTAGHNAARPVGRSQWRRGTVTHADWTNPALAPDPLIALNRSGWAYARGVYDQGYSVWGALSAEPPDDLPWFLPSPEHRRMVFVERTARRVWVFDEMASPDPVAWEVFWHIDAASLSLTAASQPGQRFFVASKDDPDNARLSIWLASDPTARASVSAAAGQTYPSPQGWIQDAWTAPRPIPTLTATLAPSTGTRLLSVFEPGGGKLASLTEEGSAGAEDRARLYSFAKAGETAKTLLLFNPVREAVSLGAIATDAECAALWLSSDPRWPGIVAWAVVEGSFLEFQGATLFAADEPVSAHGSLPTALVAR
jgi:hypothetical protein